MTQESTAFGTCYLRAKTKKDIMDFFDLQAASERYIWHETTLELPDDYENAFIETKDGLYELNIVSRILHPNKFGWSKRDIT